MTLFELPELVDLIAYLLAPNDLARMIKEDYLAQQLLESEEEKKGKFTVLSKYGPWIQELFLSFFDSSMASPDLLVSRQANLTISPESNTTDKLGPLVLKACPNLKKLTVNHIPDACLGLLAVTLRSHLRELSAIELYCPFVPNKDSPIAEMLAACHAGWKHVRISILGIHSAEALIKHCPTLEALEVHETRGWTSSHLYRILSSCPRIHTFATLVDGESRATHETHFLAQDFIDFNHTSNSLAPWKSESSLKVFKAKVMGIPRPGVTPYDHYKPAPEKVLREAYPGQSQELQHQVYKRLARFSHLEILQLGHESRDVGDLFLFDEGDADYQCECLEMSLKSGLWILEGLKELRVLNVMRMETKI
ncbi:hypothetical protein BGZ68_010983, partial [Mortierella alpina]